MSALEKIDSQAGHTDDETYLLVRRNAIRCHGLERFGIER
jgi:hypothetical protein